MADLGDSPTLNPMQGYGDANTTAIPKTLGFDARWIPVLQMLMAQRQAGYDPSAPTSPDSDISTYNDASLPMWKRVGLQAPPPISGPQQSYSMASNLQGSGDGSSGQALRQTSSYNNSPYSPQGTVSNTGQPAGPPQAGSQGELTGQGGQGWNIYQTTPTWTGSPLSQSPDARDEGDFKAPPLTGPQSPLGQRQAQIRQLILQSALANIPRGYHFKLG